MPARLSPRAAIAAIAVIALAAVGIIVLGMLRAPEAGSSFATGHEHGGAASAPAATPAEQERADELVAATAAAVAPYSDVAAAEASGYRWVGDDGGQYRHYVRGDYLLDDSELDPGRIESLVYRVRDDGGQELVSGMYILSPGTAEVPDIAGAPWHVHTNLCFDSSGSIAGTNDAGSCPRGSFNVATPPMLHVWVVDNPDGPFAAVDENGIVSSETATENHVHG